MPDVSVRPRCRFETLGNSLAGSSFPFCPWRPWRILLRPASSHESVEDSITLLSWVCRNYKKCLSLPMGYFAHRKSASVFKTILKKSFISAVHLIPEWRALPGPRLHRTKFSFA
jgi:hypothetical protein